jgi:hypothetical protein
MPMPVVPFPRLLRKRRRPPARPGPAESDTRALRTALKFAATAQAVWTHSSGPDPNLDRARRLVAAYERSRDEAARNYDHPVYREALATLDRVDPESPSADTADRMRARLTSRIRAFRTRQQSRDRLLAEQQRQRVSRTPAP